MARVENMGGAYGSSTYGSGSGFGTTYYEYDPNGNVTTKVLANNCYTYFEYDAANRTTKILNCLPDGSPLACRTIRDLCCQQTVAPPSRRQLPANGSPPMVPRMRGCKPHDPGVSCDRRSH